MRSPYALALTLSLLPLAFAAGACSLIDLPEATDPIEGAGGSGGDGGGEEPAACETVTDCLETGTDCILRDCVDGACVYSAAADFVPISNQAVGDCVQVVCDGEGGEKKVNVEDPFDDGKECTVDSCASGVTKNESVEGSSCATGVCNLTGNCVECVVEGDCTDTNAPLCQGGACVPPSCANSMKDNGETGVDCGGPCAPCPENEECLVGADCQSGVCDDTLHCAAPTCFDGVLNGLESDEDCGGMSCLGCEAGEICNAPADCESIVCVQGLCKAASCTDGVQNGSETDVDCGGGTCSPCSTGKSCKLTTDCASKVCETNICQAPTCSDGVKNGSEAGIDCGGSCPACSGGGKQPPVRRAP
ncbi:MAG: hypothetical protein KC731_16535 [Myxococcales bacterium]|nr:hypothetical protein [Myxococcales bacterium]